MQADFGQFDVPNNANRMSIEGAFGGLSLIPLRFERRCGTPNRTPIWKICIRKDNPTGVFGFIPGAPWRWSGPRR